MYTYDLGGNILKKEGYPKLTDIDNELPETPSKVIEYAYDAEWKDLLVSYDGKPTQYTPDTLPQMPDDMTYFHMGNPYRFDGWTYEWQAGRQLKSMTHRNELDVQDKKLEFSYDAAGLRTQKKYTYTDTEGHAVVETTDYILHGKLLTHQKTTTTVDGVEQEPYQLHFYYDKDSRPIMVRVGNEEAESQYYSYVHNLQGDILGIIDKEQDLVVEYAYDPWGKPLGACSLTTERDELATLNPFRYRGYVYDAETELYYLRSRYYNPKWGRFVSADGLLGRVRKLLSHNLFAYCRNNPVRRKDDEGREGVDSAEYKEFTDIFANTYGIEYESYIDSPVDYFDKTLQYITISFEPTKLTKGTYIETDMDRLLEDNVTNTNALGLALTFLEPAALLSYGLTIATGVIENNSRYSLGDIERDAFAITYKKSEAFGAVYPDGAKLIFLVDYEVTEVYTIGVGRKNGKPYFDSGIVIVTKSVIDKFLVDPAGNIYDK